MAFYPSNEIEEADANSLLEKALEEKNLKKRISIINDLLRDHPLFIDARIHLAYIKNPKDTEKELLKLLLEVENELKAMKLYDENIHSFGLIEETKKELEVLYYIFDYYFSMENYKKAYEFTKKSLFLDYTDTYSLKYYNLLLTYKYDKENYFHYKEELGDDISTVNILMSVLDNTMNPDQARELLNTYHPHLLKYLNGKEEADDKTMESISSMITIPFGTMEEDLYALNLILTLLEKEYNEIIEKLI